MSIGKLETTRDWTKSGYYTKAEVANFFIKNNDYTAYKLTIIDDPGSEVTVTGGTSGVVETVEIPDSGSATKLMFFSTGETVTVTDGDATTTKVLSSRIDSVDLTQFKSFNLFEQTGITISNNKQTDYGYQLEFQNGVAVGLQGANVCSMFSVPIPAGYNKLYIDMETTGVSGAYNYCDLTLRDAFGITGCYSGNYSGNDLKTVFLIDYTTGVYSFNRKTVEIDISNINVDFYIGLHRCDNSVKIYSIVAAFA